jgi:exoribonuclease-2
MAFDLADRARRALLELGFLPDFPPDAQAQVSALQRAGGPSAVRGVEDLRGLLWSSIDNPDSMDLDQLECAEALPDGSTRLLVAIADVDALVPEGSPIDRRAGANTASLYTGAAIFPMLPRPLSEDLTSLLPDVDRLSVVIGYRVRPDGSVVDGTVRRAWVRNRAKLNYSEVGPWLQGEAPVPPRVAAVSGLEEQLRLQDRATRALRAARDRAGALMLRTIEPRPVMADGTVVDLQEIPDSRSRELIEDLMVAANGVMARFLDSARRSSSPAWCGGPSAGTASSPWPRGWGPRCPPSPMGWPSRGSSSGRGARDPLHFPDLSLAVVKLLGPASTCCGRPARTHPGTSGSRRTTTATPPRRTAAIRTSSPSAW